MSILKIAAEAARKFLFACTLASFVFGADAEAQNLTKKEIESSVGKIAEIIKDNYVFAEKGKSIAARFSNEHALGKFDGAKSWQEFSLIAAKVLRDLSGDGHLFVRYDPKQAKELLTTPDDAANSDEEDSFFHGNAAREKNYGFSEVKIFDGNLGYLKLSEINISEKSLPTLFAAMRFVSNTRALTIDLRDNGGGGSEIGAVLESFFIPKNVALLESRSRSGNVEVSKTVSWLTEKKYDQPVYIIVNQKTASAAEAFAYSLQAKKRAKIVGQPSAGGANMSSWYAVNEHIFVSVSTGAPVLPGTEESWEGKGVQPDFSVAPGQEIEFVRRTVTKK